MANCPSALPTAVTKVDDIDGGVTVTVTVTNQAAYARLLELAVFHTRLDAPDRVVAPHSGLHGGPGVFGRCPIIHLGTRVGFEHVLDGIRFVILSLPGYDYVDLRVQTRSRASNLPQFANAR